MSATTKGGQNIQTGSTAQNPTATPVMARGKGRTTFLVALILASLALAVASLALGSRSIPPDEVIAALRGAGEQDIRDIVWNLRMPRTFLAYFAGAALAVAGVLAQSWTRNPLADPGFIGITAGASFFVALGTAIGIATTTGMRTTLALVGAGITTLLVLAVSRRFQDPLTLILVGAGVSAALGSGAVIIGLYSTDVLDSMRRWTIGSTFGRGPEDVAIAGLGLLIGLACAAMAARPLDLLAMGEESSLALGGSPTIARVGAALSVVVLAGSATAATGPIAFVGFAIPHIVRRVVGPSVATMILPSALLGGCAVLAADIIGRLIVGNSELEMSIVLAIVGAPFLIWGAHRGVGRAWGDNA
ncbi:iron chelate uptake ABC transporter family permease subunit [Corynebacterium macginleyi]|uniref:Iron ABC transporter permease n=1 Tax=Corynebacterium macginleyi TaxID=38290 RepID=A0ABS1Y421_9CORY|nr:iron ABC transporter permease [Corynebacterium macginleyi]MBK4140694.1 iron chelate uptake ABC transporter family permease subunit [Corynebacterium macginleyi]MBK4143015.1 iron chelate uptake ABC transporter family permease subunit [Corynebacterium macginleyi]MBK4143552.1 iron chelate uptake ABC transporter family permease subunit [Corynebacterium macginleyi]MBK4147992.1 iron chelate uptake ABC transporter family permease subunit [Corynebacterium macginleyi]MBK4157401.1 iron chelate uptake 